MARIAFGRSYENKSLPTRFTISTAAHRIDEPPVTWDGKTDVVMWLAVETTLERLEKQTGAISPVPDHLSFPTESWQRPVYVPGIAPAAPVSASGPVLPPPNLGIRRLLADCDQVRFGVRDLALTYSPSQREVREISGTVEIQVRILVGYRFRAETIVNSAGQLISFEGKPFRVTGDGIVTELDDPLPELQKNLGVEVRTDEGDPIYVLASNIAPVRASRCVIA